MHAPARRSKMLDIAGEIAVLSDKVDSAVRHRFKH